MTAKTLANHYSQLSAEERFRLIVAAADRGDEAERERLQNASKRITFSNVDYSPFAQAIQELAILIFLELLEEAATRRTSWHRFSISFWRIRSISSPAGSWFAASRL
jgi:hypothetical protein